MQVNSRFQVLAASFVLASALAGCGAHGRAQADESSEFSVRQAVRCTVEPYPDPLPAVAALVDTAELNPRLRALMADTAGHVVLTLEYEKDGQNIRRSLLEHTVGLNSDSTQELVFQSLGRMPETERPWGVRMRIDVGPQVAYAVSRREYCPPRPRNREMLWAIEGYSGGGVRYRGAERERTVLLRVTVSTAGTVESAQILQGELPGSSLERTLRDYVRQFLFVPATVDGVPVVGEVSVPIRIRA